MVEPCELKPYCSHRFCAQCITAHFDVQIEIDESLTCPLCRTMIPDDFELKIDFKYQKFIRQNYSEDFLKIQK